MCRLRKPPSSKSNSAPADWSISSFPFSDSSKSSSTDKSSSADKYNDLCDRCVCVIDCDSAFSLSSAQFVSVSIEASCGVGDDSVVGGGDDSVFFAVAVVEASCGDDSALVTGGDGSVVVAAAAAVEASCGDGDDSGVVVAVGNDSVVVAAAVEASYGDGDDSVVVLGGDDSVGVVVGVVSAILSCVLLFRRATTVSVLSSVQV